MYEFVLDLLEYRYRLKSVLAVGIDFPEHRGIVSFTRFDKQLQRRTRSSSAQPLMSTSHTCRSTLGPNYWKR